MSASARDAALRQALTNLLRGEGAHVSLTDAVKGLCPEWRTHRPPGLHSIWQLLEHIRIAQHDLLRYTLDPAWRSPEWPGGYWPDNRSDLSERAWAASLQGFQRDQEAFVGLVQDPTCDLYAPLPHRPEHTYLRQVLLAADHTAYHTGQIVDLRRMLGDWPPLENSARGAEDHTPRA